MQIRLTRAEEEFARSKDTCRRATIGKDGWPHNVPVGYLYKNGMFHIPASGDSKKISNIKANDRVCIVIDDDVKERGLMFQGHAEMATGKRSLKLKAWMVSKTGWTMGRSTVIVILKPARKASWGI